MGGDEDCSEGERMSKNPKMSIPEIIDFAKSESCHVYKLAVVAGGSGGRPFEVMFDYDGGTVSYWETHEEARAEAARLWQSGEASYIDDFIVARAEREIAIRLNETQERAFAGSTTCPQDSLSEIIQTVGRTLGEAVDLELPEPDMTTDQKRDAAAALKDCADIFRAYAGDFRKIARSERAA